ncbi:MAG: cold-shock protein [Rubrimonas sp.]|uniref:cold-shock protein n=1 Tax=Rubrimonas sp. TaxID=2036015 RepID=UPI002FDD6B73
MEEPSEIEPIVVRGRVKWYDSVKGYGFIVGDEVDQDILAHANCVRASGRSSLPEGARVTLQAALFERGWQAIEILEVEPVPPAQLGERPSDFAQAAEAIGPLQPARVKWFDRAKGFGFINIFGDVKDVFVHMEVLRRSGLSDLAPGEAVAARTMQGPRGLMAAEVRQWEEAATESAAQHPQPESVAQPGRAGR